MVSRPLRTSLIFLTFLASIHACRQTRTGGSPDGYTENGQIWAFGNVQLTDLDAPGAIMLKREASGQTLNTYRLFGAVRANDIGGGERDLAYVDYHPTADKLLAYAYKLQFVTRAGYNGNVIDVFANVLKPGRTYPDAYRLTIGTANFQSGADFATLTLSQGLKLDLIADGVFAGQWALHFPDVPKIVTKPWAGMCPKAVSQMPGQTPGQNPGQFDSCRPVPSTSDLCAGDPTKEGCRPTPPVQQPLESRTGGEALDQAEPPKATTGLEALSAEELVYVMNADVPEAKIIFQSAATKAESDEANAQTCARKFFAVGRTVGRQVNTSCVLKPAPASVQDGMLTCALTVEFDRAETYLERICDVTVTFRGKPDEVQHIQVLKR